MARLPRTGIFRHANAPWKRHHAPPAFPASFPFGCRPSLIRAARFLQDGASEGAVAKYFQVNIPMPRRIRAMDILTYDARAFSDCGNIARRPDDDDVKSI